MTTAQQEITVIGGAQAGLATSYQLSRLGLEHVVLDASEHAGDTWRHRWDSLRLFTPARIDHLDGMRPAGFGRPADQGRLRRLPRPVRAGVRPAGTARCPRRATVVRRSRISLSTTAGSMHSDVVVIAMSSLQRPRVPQFASALDPAILSLHSSRVPQSRSAQTGECLGRRRRQHRCGDQRRGRAQPPDVARRPGERASALPDRRVLRSCGREQDHRFRVHAHPQHRHPDRPAGTTGDAVARRPVVAGAAQGPAQGGGAPGAPNRRSPRRSAGRRGRNDAAGRQRDLVHRVPNRAHATGWTCRSATTTACRCRPGESSTAIPACTSWARTTSTRRRPRLCWG